MSALERFGIGTLYLLFAEAQGVAAVYCFHRGAFYWMAIWIVSSLKTILDGQRWETRQNKYDDEIERARPRIVP